MKEIVLVKMQTDEQLKKMSALATAILKEHYDPIVGENTNDHMLKKYQSTNGIKNEVDGGAEYYFVILDGKEVGFIAIDAKNEFMYLSKFYLAKSYRGNGYSSAMMDFVKKQTLAKGLKKIRLNVNAANSNTIDTYRHFGFEVVEELQKDVGDGFSVHDYVMECKIN
ncbi:MAG: GNAT family N-acetyltransferase [Clostridia bacterium]|nr:GNAT family N-acetyltransferase [Clostridia bacterium]MDE7079034.1 GNAT family N-acetyltransferase [Clostridia bacterium]